MLVCTNDNYPATLVSEDGMYLCEECGTLAEDMGIEAYEIED